MSDGELVLARNAAEVNRGTRSSVRVCANLPVACTN
jgi:hypothetical protein